MPCGDKRCSTLLYLLILSEALSFLDGSNVLIIGLLLLIGEINGENANIEFCAFGMLQIWYQRKILIFLMGYGIWSLHIGG